MLPEFPKAKKRTDELWMAAMMAGMRSDPFLAGIAIRVQKEGRRAKVDGTETNYVPASVTTTLKAEVGRGLTVDEFYDAADSLGKKMGEQQAKHLFKVMEQPSEVTQPFNFGPEVTIDDILGVWDKMFVRFKDGKPQWPPITSSPDVIERLQVIIEQSLNDPVARTKWQALVDKKRRQFDEREARRRLVD